MDNSVYNYCINNFDCIKSKDNLFGKFLGLFKNKSEYPKSTNYIRYCNDSFLKPYSNHTLNTIEESKIINMLQFRSEVKNECNKELIKVLENILNLIN